MSSEAGTFISYATAPGAVAADGKGTYSPFTAALLEHLKISGLEIEQLFREVRRTVVLETGGQQVPWTQSSLIAPFYFVPPPEVSLPAPSAGLVAAAGSIPVDESLRTELVSDEVQIRGQRVAFLGGSLQIKEPVERNILRAGLNTIVVAGHEVRAWYEEQRLRVFEEPYKHSYAVVVAIDDYGGNARTGYPDLGYMVEGAQALADRLAKLGFPKKNIFSVFDKDATVDHIDSLLREFWEGGNIKTQIDW
jgi:hypothetical protein